MSLTQTAPHGNPQRQDDVLLLSLDRARELEEAGRYAEAKAEMSGVWGRVGEEPDSSGLSEHVAARLWLRVGSLTGWLGSSRQIAGAQELAKDLIFRAATVFEAEGDGDALAEARTCLAICYWRGGEFDEARVTARSSMDAASGAREKARALLTVSIVEHAAGRPHDAAAALQSARPFVDDSGSDTLRAVSHNRAALIHRAVGTATGRADFFVAAELEYISAIYFFKKAGHLAYAARCENNLGFVYLMLGKYAAAHERLDEAAAIFESLKEKGSAAQVRETRARVHLAEGDRAAAESAARAAARALSDGDESALLAEALTTRGVALARLGREEEARVEFNRAAEIAGRVGDKVGAGLARLTMVEELRAHLARAEALAYLEESERLLAGTQSAEITRRLKDAAWRLLAEGGAAGAIPDTWEGFTLKRAMFEYESALIARAMRDAGGIVLQASKLLGMRSYQLLQDKLGGTFRHLCFLQTNHKRKSIVRQQGPARIHLLRKGEIRPTRFLPLLISDDSLSALGPRAGDRLVVHLTGEPVEGNVCVVNHAGRYHHGRLRRDGASLVLENGDGYEPAIFEAGAAKIVGPALGYMKPGDTTILPLTS